MEQTLLQVFPLAVGASISPFGLLLVMVILSKSDHPKRKASLFVLGSAVFLVILGIIVLFTYETTQVASRPAHDSATIDIILGFLIVVLVLKSYLSKNKEKPKEVKSKKPFFIFGFLCMLINFSTLVPFIAANKILADHKLNIWDNSIIFMVILFVTMFMISFPVVVTYIFPDKSERILKPVKNFMSRRGKTIINAYFLFIAGYLILRGINLV